MVGFGQGMLTRSQEVGADVVAWEEVDGQDLALLPQQKDPLLSATVTSPTLARTQRGHDSKTSGPALTHDVPAGVMAGSSFAHRGPQYPACAGNRKSFSSC